MIEKKENFYILLNNKFEIIKIELFKEWKHKFPSYHILESSSIKVIDILKNSNIVDEEFKSWSARKIINMEIFKSDLVGELHHDYDNRLVRYFSKWDREKVKIYDLIIEFRTEFNSRMY